LVSLYSTIKMMHGPINIRFTNPQPFYSFRGLKIRCGLESRSWAGFWKNYRAAAHAVRTLQYNTIIHYFIYDLSCYIIFITYYSSDSPSSLITESLSVTQSLSSLSSSLPSHRCGLEPRNNFFFFSFKKSAKTTAD